MQPPAISCSSSPDHLAAISSDSSARGLIARVPHSFSVYFLVPTVTSTRIALRLRAPLLSRRAELVKTLRPVVSASRRQPSDSSSRAFQRPNFASAVYTHFSFFQRRVGFLIRNCRLLPPAISERILLVLFPSDLSRELSLLLLFRVLHTEVTVAERPCILGSFWPLMSRLDVPETFLSTCRSTEGRGFF